MTNPKSDDPWWLSYLMTIMTKVANDAAAAALRDTASYLETAGVDQVHVDAIYDRATAKDNVRIVRVKKAP